MGSWKNLAVLSFFFVGMLACLVVATGTLAWLDARDVAGGEAPHTPVWIVSGDPPRAVQVSGEAPPAWQAPRLAEGRLALDVLEAIRWTREPGPPDRLVVSWSADDRSTTSVWEISAQGPRLIASRAFGPEHLFRAIAYAGFAMFPFVVFFWWRVLSGWVARLRSTDA